MRKLQFIITLFFMLNISSQEIWSFNFLHPSDIIQKMKTKFKSIKTYKGNFKLIIKEGKKQKLSSGRVYYKRGGKINFSFNNGDKIISNGKKMWVYIASLRAVGIQNLKYKRNGKSIYDSANYEGLVRMFERYHINFNTQEQPQTIKGKSYYVFKLIEKVSSGGYKKLIVFVNPQTFLINKIQANNLEGKTISLEYKNIQINKEIPSKYFYYKVKGSTRVVENVLTSE